MAFVIGQAVWFKRSGSTPFATGSPSDAGVTAQNQLGGRGKAAITITGSQFGIGRTQGVPQILTGDILPNMTSSDGFPTTTISGVGLNLGVREQTVVNPLAPKSVATDDIFDEATPASLFNTGTFGGRTIDEGAVDRTKTNTLRTIDPNFPTGRPNAAVAEGKNTPVGGTQEFVSEVIDNATASKVVGLRTPSSEQQAGFVVEIVTCPTTSVSPDGTKCSAGKMYWVQWGTPNVSNPHATKWNNKMRSMLHAEEDLVSP